MTYVLRKTFGAHSAGTVVHQVIEGQWYCGHTTNVVPDELVVKRRSMTTTRPHNTSSRERNRVKRAKRKALQDAPPG